MDIEPEHSRHKRSTRSDVARLAGVSTAVVSYVFNNGPRNVAPDTEERVREAAKKLQYRPNSIARALRTGSSHTFGVIIPDFSNPYFASINDSLEMTASERGYSTLFVASHGESSSEQSCIAKLMSRDVDAIFAASAQNASVLSSMNDRNCRFVVLDYPQPIPKVKCVSTDFRAASYACVQHLIRHGHTNTAMLYGGDTNSSDVKMVQGWFEAHQEADLIPGPIKRSYFTREGGYHATLELLDGDNPPTAIFAASDLEASGALRAIHERGLRIPEDIAIVSFDGTIETLYSWPQLTTFQQNTAEIARCAVDAALKPDAVPDVQLIEGELVRRQSCGCMPL